MAHANLTLDLRSYSSETHAHQHDYHQLVLPVTGRLSMRVGGQEGAVSAQRIAVIAAGREHGFAATDLNCFVVADVPEALAPELARLPAFIPLDKTLSQYVAFLHLKLQQGPGNRTSERQMLLLLIQLLQERYGDALRLDRRIEAARAYLDQYSDRPTSLTRLAAVANLSTRQLSELFRRQLGMTPQQYLLEKRMQRAWQLLEADELDIQQIAERVGYGSLSAFSDRFRKHFGHSPRYFRRIGK
ncbi:AraC family transcriptional regulator [Sedimenticola hydrogenitrophicus]|uniref:AraC family transcriptional regulator n=1 Tax=Sedimenticola hydrogenitrophicus TaxID=2967975 RepID=UPI0021A61F8B|nr:AraC family transcriptional regulator [Sedimenticola hydrogenitrophicus]